MSSEVCSIGVYYVFSPNTKGESKMKFEIYEDGLGEFRWQLMMNNNKVVAESTHGYVKKYSAKRAVESIIDNAYSAEIVEIED